MTDTTEITEETEERAPFAFQPDSEGELTLQAAVYQAIGAASVCWEHMTGTGIYDDGRAVEIAEALLERIRAHAEDAEDSTPGIVGTDGFVLVQYRAGSGHPSVPGSHIYNDVEDAGRDRKERQHDLIAARRNDRLAVARLQVLR